MSKFSGWIALDNNVLVKMTDRKDFLSSRYNLCSSITAKTGFMVIYKQSTALFSELEEAEGSEIQSFFFSPLIYLRVSILITEAESTSVIAVPKLSLIIKHQSRVWRLLAVIIASLAQTQTPNTANQVM